MSKSEIEVQRRTVLQMTMALAGAAQVGAAPASAAEPAKATPPQPTGKPGDFGFLSGEWRIKNRQRKSGAWDEFDSEATVHGILGGVASIEELRIPARNFSGMGLRLLDLERKLWADYWVNAKSGVLVPPPSWGSFVDGVGLWDSDEDDAAGPMIVRGAWDQITAGSCRWYQASSRDNGKSWQESWVMHWTKV